MRWINIKDQKPTELQEIIIFDKDKRMFLGCYKNNVFEVYGNCCGYYEDDITLEEITYWMPCPEKPQPEECTCGEIPGGPHTYSCPASGSKRPFDGKIWKD